MIDDRCKLTVHDLQLRPNRGSSFSMVPFLFFCALLAPLSQFFLALLSALPSRRLGQQSRVLISKIESITCLGPVWRNNNSRGIRFQYSMKLGPSIWRGSPSHACLPTNIIPRHIPFQTPEIFVEFLPELSRDTPCVRRIHINLGRQHSLLRYPVARWSCQFG